MRPPQTIPKVLMAWDTLRKALTDAVDPNGMVSIRKREGALVLGFQTDIHAKSRWFSAIPICRYAFRKSYVFPRSWTPGSATCNHDLIIAHTSSIVSTENFSCSPTVPFTWDALKLSIGLSLPFWTSPNLGDTMLSLVRS